MFLILVDCTNNENCVTTKISQSMVHLYWNTFQWYMYETVQLQPVHRGVTTIEAREATASSLFVSVHVDLHSLICTQSTTIATKWWSFPHFSLRSVRKCPKINIRGCQIQNFSGGACPQTPQNTMASRATVVIPVSQNPSYAPVTYTKLLGYNRLLW